MRLFRPCSQARVATDNTHSWVPYTIYLRLSPESTCGSREVECTPHHGIIGHYVTSLRRVVVPVLYLACLHRSEASKTDISAVKATHRAGQASQNFLPSIGRCAGELLLAIRRSVLARVTLPPYNVSHGISRKLVRRAHRLKDQVVQTLIDLLDTKKDSVAQIIARGRRRSKVHFASFFLVRHIAIWRRLQKLGLVLVFNFLRLFRKQV